MEEGKSWSLPWDCPVSQSSKYWSQPQFWHFWVVSLGSYEHDLYPCTTTAVMATVEFSLQGLQICNIWFKVVHFRTLPEEGARVPQSPKPALQVSHRNKSNSIFEGMFPNSISYLSVPFTLPILEAVPSTTADQSDYVIKMPTPSFCILFWVTKCFDKTNKVEVLCNSCSSEAMCMF